MVPEQIVETIKNNNNFLIVSHSDPDGDAVGSMFGMGYLLDILGKNFYLYNPSGVPKAFQWLTPPGKVLVRLNGNVMFDWVVFLDCSDISRVEGSETLFADVTHIINIDHHIDNTFFGSINWVDSNASSVGEMIAEIVEEFGIQLKDELAESLFLAIVSDTGSFSYSNTTSRSFVLAAKILENGLDLGKFTSNFSRQWTIEKAHLHGMALVNSATVLDGMVGVIKVTQDMLNKTGASIEDCSGVVNYMRQIKGVLVAVSLREEQDGTTKFSLRSWGEVDVQKIAAVLGGGGHPNASGGRIELPIEEAEEEILRVIKEVLNV